MLLQCPRFAMRQALILLCVLAIACGQQVGEDGYTDDNRPYEFGFNIEGYQHRHEMKDENGIIMGEFGFITADGIYHVTVYATDENGDFKILKMKNIRVGFPPGTPLMPAAPGGATGRGFAPNSAPLPASTTIRTPTSTVNPKFTVASGCGSCKVPVTTTRKPQIAPSRPPSFAARGRPFPAAFPRAETTENPDAGSQGNGQPPAGGIFGQIPGSNVIGGTPLGQVPGFGSLPNNGTLPFVPNNGNVPFIPNNGTIPFVPNNGTIPFVPSNGNVPFVPNNGTIPFVPSNGNVPFVPNNGTIPFVPSNGNVPFGQVPGTDVLGQIPGGAAVFGGSPPGNQSSDTPITGQFPGTNAFGGVLPTNGTPGFPTGGIPSIPGVPGGENPSFPSPIPGGVFGDVPIEPDSGKPPVGVEQPGLPNGITENDIKDLLYRFNYTAGYHGHHESGYRNGNKEGGYFANGRDGVGQRVNYLANQFGYQPNITFVELSAADTPQEETEKNAGLKGYAFEWFYRKRR